MKTKIHMIGLEIEEVSPTPTNPAVFRSSVRFEVIGLAYLKTDKRGTAIHIGRYKSLVSDEVVVKDQEEKSDRNVPPSKIKNLLVFNFPNKSLLEKVITLVEKGKLVACESVICLTA